MKVEAEFYSEGRNAATVTVVDNIDENGSRYAHDIFESIYSNEPRILMEIEECAE
jgi:hypothetical protein